MARVIGIAARTGFLVLLAVFAAGACGAGRVVGGPAPVSGQRCEGVPVAVCARMREDASRSAPPGAGAVVGIWVRCTTTCTEAAGEASVVVTYANGQTIETGQGWAAAIGPPIGEPSGPPVGEPGVEATPLPVEPVCLGVGRDRCLEYAATAVASGPSGVRPVSVTVRCSAVCDAARGEGSTETRFADGTSVMGNWSYSGEPAQPVP